MKCQICEGKIETTFLNKIIGSYVKDKKGKRHVICPKCQKLPKEEITTKL